MPKCENVCSFAFCKLHYRSRDKSILSMAGMAILCRSSNASNIDMQLQQHVRFVR
jgi:hypothetical protein